MSFSFTFFGEANKVNHQVGHYKASGDEKHVNLIKTLVNQVALGAPRGSNLFVEANGHHDYTTPDRQNANIDLKIRVKREDAEY